MCSSLDSGEGSRDGAAVASALDAPPVEDNVLTNLDSSFEHGVFGGLTFSFNGKSDKEFVTALNGKAGRPDR